MTLSALKIRSFMQLACMLAVVGAASQSAAADQQNNLDLFGLNLDSTYDEMSEKLVAQGYTCMPLLPDEFLLCLDQGKATEITLGPFFVALLYTYGNDLLSELQEASRFSYNEATHNPKFIVRHRLDGQESITVGCGTISSCNYSSVEVVDKISERSALDGHDFKLVRPDILLDLFQLVDTVIKKNDPSAKVKNLIDISTIELTSDEVFAPCTSIGQEEVCAYEGRAHIRVATDGKPVNSPESFLDQIRIDIPLKLLMLRRRAPIGLN